VAPFFECQLKNELSDSGVEQGLVNEDEVFFDNFFFFFFFFFFFLITVQIDIVAPKQLSLGVHVRAHLKELIGLAVATILGFVVLFLPIFGDQEGAKRCLSLVVFVAVCWSTTALPPFVTAFTIPFLVVTLSILPFPATTAATTISMAFFDPVILLFLGGLTFAAALDKYKLNQRLALLVLRVAGDKPIWNLAALMGLCFFLSMWVTNVAASVVGVSIAKPIIDKLQKNDPYAKAMLLGICTACNTGGMATPIASPQNAIAVLWVQRSTNGLEQISFVSWMGYAVPPSLLLTVIYWLFLYWMFRPHVRRKREFCGCLFERVWAK
jgi:phosphate transporter